MKRTLSLLSFTGLLCLCLFVLTPSASAAEVVDSGYCGGEGDGTNLTWTLTDDGVLTIEGEGEMADWDWPHFAPWCGYSSQIYSLSFEGNVTSIGSYAFFYMALLDDEEGYKFKTITIPESIISIGEGAFYDCYALQIVFVQGDAPAKVNEAFPEVSLVYPQDVTPWTEEWDVVPYAWDETVSTSAVTLDLIDGNITLYELNGVSYCLQAGVAKATTGGVLIRQSDSGSSSTANTITIAGGKCSVNISDLNISSKYSPIDIKSGAFLDLTLLGSNTLAGTNSSGIHVPEGANLVVSGVGIVTANGGEDSSGIGGNYHGNAGFITINSGTVTAVGGSNSAAGIGGGNYGNGGDIVINGGTINAIGSVYGAGIGGGYSGAGGKITINGGNVLAESGSYNVGIGTRGGGGTVIINGGTITVNGGNRSGSIDIGAFYGGIIDAVTISDKATVTNADGEAPYVVETIFIDTQPMTTAAHNGNTPVLSVAAHNHSGLSYQWQVSSDKSSWTELEGQTSPQTTFPMSADLNGKYVRCKLTNGWGNVLYTDTVQVWTLAFSQQPVSVEANLNDLAAFNAASTCSNVTYQWQRSYDNGESWVDVPGETYGTLAVNATLSESSAKYRCVITSTNGDQLASDVVEIKLDAGALVTYTTRYYQQNPDGQGYTLVNQQVLEGISGQTVTIPETSYEGFTENTQAGTLIGTVTGDSGLVLARYYDRNTYQITFQMNGGSVLPPLEARYEADITPPSNPSRFAYTFTGWYADEALTEEYTFTTMPLGGATIYAKWVPVGADRGIEYHINGLAVRDSSTFELLDSIPTGKFLVEVSVTNLKATAVDAILLVQYTEDGRMLGMQYLYASTQAGQTVTFGASVDNTDGKIGKIKAMILPSLGSPVPLANAVEMM